MVSASGISNDLTNPETTDSFSENTAPFCKVVSKNEQTFSQYMGDPGNLAMVELGNEGIVGWLNVRRKNNRNCSHHTEISQRN